MIMVVHQAGGASGPLVALVDGGTAPEKSVAIGILLNKGFLSFPREVTR